VGSSSSLRLLFGVGIVLAYGCRHDNPHTASQSQLVAILEDGGWGRLPEPVHAVERNGTYLHMEGYELKIGLRGHNVRFFEARREGKAYGSVHLGAPLPQSELKTLTPVLDRLAIGRFGHEVIVRNAFDGGEDRAVLICSVGPGSLHAEFDRRDRKLLRWIESSPSECRLVSRRRAAHGPGRSPIPVPER
jgi:hypothetical protein